MSQDQTRAVPSSLVVTMSLPSGLNAPWLTPSVCPFNSTNGLPFKSHRRAVWSSLVVTMNLPSGLKAA